MTAKLRVFYDGDCPLCLKEINFLRWWDSNGDVTFTDISAPDFTPPADKTYQELMDKIHAHTPSDGWIVGPDVFVALYRAVGLGFVSTLISLPGVSWVVARSYDWFARNRLRITGRCEDETCKTHH